jgi:hypothetical protein
MKTLRLLVFTQGSYGERILDNIRQRAPQGWMIQHKLLPQTLPLIVDDPEDVVADLKLNGMWDLILFMGESPSVFSLLPTILKHVSVQAVISPVDDYSWLPLGLEQQIRRELGDVKVVFPRPFCSLTPIGVPPIDEFTHFFGRPRLSLETEGDTVRRVKVLRGAPCGSTWYMAERLPGAKVEDACARAATLVQIYPCLASRQIERLLSDAPIHVAAHLVQKAIKSALNEECRS